MKSISQKNAQGTTRPWDDTFATRAECLLDYLTPAEELLERLVGALVQQVDEAALSEKMLKMVQERAGMIHSCLSAVRDLAEDEAADARERAGLPGLDADDEKEESGAAVENGSADA